MIIISLLFCSQCLNTSSTMTTSKTTNPRSPCLLKLIPNSFPFLSYIAGNFFPQLLPIVVQIQQLFISSCQVQFMYLWMLVGCVQPCLQQLLHAFFSSALPEHLLWIYLLFNELFLVNQKNQNIIFRAFINIVIIPIQDKQKLPSLMPLTKLLLILPLLITVTIQTLGVSTYPYTPNYTTASFKCIYQKGFKDVAFTLLHSKTQIKPEYIQSLINIKNAGMNVTISYIPCASKSAVDQISQFVKKINKTLYDRVWIEPSDNKEDTECSWVPAITKQSQAAENCKFLTTLLQQLKKSGIKTGVVSSSILWKYYFGTTCYQLGSELLYWLYPDDIPSFDGFYAFAGWKSPAAKEYGLSEHVCQVMLDYYYHP